MSDLLGLPCEHGEDATLCEQCWSSPCCRRIVTMVGPKPFVRCNLPEAHPIHDPTSDLKGRHPFRREPT